ncbi:MAG: GNAT family N-acetyltransferase [Chloroflexi bacterium]|nr:GNAT family N-acetyltransferase [Chloroflexota bacterium]
MNIEIIRATRGDTAVLRHLYELYCHDFSEFTGSDVDATGMYTDDGFLSGYWREPDWSSFLVKVDGHWAGFAWVLKSSLFRPGAEDTTEETRLRAQGTALQEVGFLEGEHHLIEEFFVMRKYRHQGVGEHVAHRLFDLYPGIWEVSEIVENIPAQAFWRKVIGRYTGGKFVEVILDNDLWRGPVQVFASRRGTKGG